MEGQDSKKGISVNGKTFSQEDLLRLKQLSGGNIIKYLKRQEFLEQRLEKKKRKNRAKNKVAKKTRKAQKRR